MPRSAGGASFRSRCSSSPSPPPRPCRQSATGATAPPPPCGSGQRPSNAIQNGEEKTMEGHKAKRNKTAAQGFGFGSLLASLGAVLALAAPNSAGATPINKNTIYLSG